MVVAAVATPLQAGQPQASLCSRPVCFAVWWLERNTSDALWAREISPRGTTKLLARDVSSRTRIAIVNPLCAPPLPPSDLTGERHSRRQVMRASQSGRRFIFCTPMSPVVDTNATQAEWSTPPRLVSHAPRRGCCCSPTRSRPTRGQRIFAQFDPAGATRPSDSASRTRAPRTRRVLSRPPSPFPARSSPNLSAMLVRVDSAASPQAALQARPPSCWNCPTNDAHTTNALCGCCQSTSMLAL
jgi:hypothetical protein